MTLATALREGSFCPQPYIPFQAAMREQTGCCSNERKKSSLPHFPSRVSVTNWGCPEERGETWVVM